jgi:hypothetical protein
MKPICPFCNRKCHYRVDNLYDVIFGLLYPMFNYDGTTEGKCKIYACTRANCRSIADDFKFYSIKTTDEELVYAGIFIRFNNKDYEVNYFSDFSGNTNNLIIIELTLDKPVSYKTIVSCKYDEVFDFDNAIEWGNRAIQRMLKLAVFF